MKSEYLKKHLNKPLLRFITCGSVDDGKSTLIGRLLYDSNLIYQDQLRLIKTGKKDNNWNFAGIVDGLQAEREQGITIDVAYRYFSTEKRKFIIADTPGHEQYTRNMVTGASNAELAIIIIDARKGILTQTKRHSYLVNLVGINKYILAINKMDLKDYEEETFNSIKKEYIEFSKKINLIEENLQFVPISALYGDNIVEKSERMNWYQGDSLLSLLESTCISEKYKHNNFRFPVQYVSRNYDNFRGYAGSIVSGTIAKGEKVTVLPSLKSSEITSLHTFDGDLSEAAAPAALTITLKDEIDIGRGDMLVKSSDVFPMSDSWEASVVWFSTEPLKLRKNYTLKIAAKLLPVEIEEVLYTVDINSLEQINSNALSQNDIALVRLKSAISYPIDLFNDNQQTGRFILIDRVTNETVCAGIVQKILEPKNISRHRHEVEPKDRVQIKPHFPTVIWLTGLSASGKSTIANALEVRLNQEGCHTFHLDGDNIRHGLCSDLKFSDEDRKENIRRVGEVAALFVDAGIITIASFISPFRKERDLVRKILNKQQFIEVFVKAPIDICESRDPKGLYKKARFGQLKGFTGVDSPYEEPLSPELTIDTVNCSIAESVEKLYTYLRQNNYLG